MSAILSVFNNNSVRVVESISNNIQQRFDHPCGQSVLLFAPTLLSDKPVSLSEIELAHFDITREP